MFSGDLQKLDAMVAGLDRLPMAIRNRVAVAQQKAAQELLDEEFASGIAADGEPWPSLAASTTRRGRHDPPLGGTSVQRDVKAQRIGTKVAIFGSTKAGYHQRGHDSPTPLPKRTMWPEQPMPERYTLAIGLATNTACLEAIRATVLEAAE